MSKKNKIAVLFPGIGYTCDKPLLYYTGKMAVTQGYELISVPYSNFPSKVKGNQKKMKKSFEIAFEQSHEILKDVKWENYDEILFVSKSIGTVVASAYAKEKKMKVRSILFTPLAQTFLFADEDAIAFHGTADPWAGDEEIIEACKKLNIPLFLTESANHSLETGDVIKDIEEMGKVMRIVSEFL